MKTFDTYWIDRLKAKEHGFDLGCYITVNGLDIFKEHGLYQVRGFNNQNKHVNRAFMTFAAVKEFIKDQTLYNCKMERY